MSDEKFIQKAVELSKKAVEAGNHPFGALLVSKDGEILLEAENTVVTDCDPTRHAELNLVSQMSRQNFDKSVIADAVLYTSCEPCMMCCGAIFWCGVRHVAYSCSHTTLAKWAGDDLLMSSRTLLGTTVTIKGPILEENGEEPHKTFWKGYT
jgi:tRNA(Arg) A34 adenosine deaminase TadA